LSIFCTLLRCAFALFARDPALKRVNRCVHGGEMGEVIRTKPGKAPI